MLASVHNRFKLICAFVAIFLFGTAPLRAAQLDIKAFKEAQAHSVAVAERIRAATVGIVNPGLSGSGMQSAGSGVVVSDDGLILTAGHVLGKGKVELDIFFPDGHRVKAKSLGANFSCDAGMAKITEPGKWPHVELGRSGDLKPGQWCIALGHPGGIQVHRTPPLRLGRILGVPEKDQPMRFLLSDATIISGDSGGPLFDLDGNVVGIHSNIGLGVSENRHVPIDVYREKWQDLVAGKQTGELPGLAGPMPPGFGGPMPDILKFGEMLRRQAQAGDPEAQALLKQGHVMTTPEQMARLMAKWGQQEESQSAGDTIDVLKFQRLLQEQLARGDAEVRGLVKDGGMPLTMRQMQDLLKKWDPSAAKVAQAPTRPAETAKPAAENAPNPAPPPLFAPQLADVERFHRMLMERMTSGDPEVQGMMKGGQLMLDGRQMRELMDKWEKKNPAEKKTNDKDATDKKAPANDTLEKKSSGDEAKADPFKNARPRGNGAFQFHANPKNATEFMDMMKHLGNGGLPGMAGDLQAGKANPELLAALQSVAVAANKSTTCVLCDGRPAVLGTVVDKRGYVVTKASELKGKITCKIGGRELPAEIVKSRDDFDLALLKVKADDLTPIAWADGDPLPLGSWLLTCDENGKPIGVGILGIPTRTVPKTPTMVLRNPAVIGALLDRTAAEARIEALAPGGPADKVGLKKDDVIIAIDGKATVNSADVVKALSDHKPGDKLALEVKRGERTLKIPVELVASDKMPAPPGGMEAENVSALSKSGGTLSRRKSDFPSALTHDIVLQAEQCGGPLLDLDGRAIALNIARADRTATYAIPTPVLRSVIANLLSDVK